MRQEQFAEMCAAYMISKGYLISRDPDTTNIVYVEGAEYDGQPNKDEPNYFNDRRLLLYFKDGWRFAHNAQATTEPGTYYTKNPLNPQGAARIAFGQYVAWQHGIHNGSQIALVQVAPIEVYRDRNRDGKRSISDPRDIGTFHINQHTTNHSGPAPTTIGKWSAGCLVGRRRQEHLIFLDILRKDQRFLDDREGFIYPTTIMPGDKLFQEFGPHASS